MPFSRCRFSSRKCRPSAGSPFPRKCARFTVCGGRPLVYAFEAKYQGVSPEARFAEFRRLESERALAAEMAGGADAEMRSLAEDELREPHNTRYKGMHLP